MNKLQNLRSVLVSPALPSISLLVACDINFVEPEQTSDLSQLSTVAVCTRSFVALDNQITDPSKISIVAFSGIDQSYIDSYIECLEGSKLTRGPTVPQNKVDHWVIGRS